MKNSIINYLESLNCYEGIDMILKKIHRWEGDTPFDKYEARDRRVVDEQHINELLNWLEYEQTSGYNLDARGTLAFSVWIQWKRGWRSADAFRQWGSALISSLWCF